MIKRIGNKLLVMLAVVMLFVLCSGADASAAVTMNSRKEVDGKLTSKQSKQKYQIVVSRTGYIKIVFEYDARDAFGTVGVYDSSGTKSGSFSFSSEKEKAVGYVAVKKGTYTVEVDYLDYLDFVNEWAEIAVSEDEEVEEAEDLDYSIKYIFYSMQESKKAVDRSNAPYLNKDSEVSGLVFEDSPKKDGNAALYKYTVSKRTKVKFHLNIRGQGMRMQILDERGRMLDLDEEDNSMFLNEDNSTYWYDQNENDTVRLDAGTYYFAIRPTKGATGFYKLELE